jgi:GH25 family lysozyme M1 (1,4-beta-N-acetylmuramidase)
MTETRLRGIDGSSVAGAGVRFAFAKATQGADPSQPWYTDQTFGTNWRAMRDAGIVRGAYHFVGLPLPDTPKSKWNDDIHRQIDHFLEIVGQLDADDLPPVLDFEDGDSPKRWRQLIASDRKGALSIVCELIQYTQQRLADRNPIIYTGHFWWDEIGDPDPVADEMNFGSCPLWFAQYPRVHPPMPLSGSPGKTDLGEASNFDEYDSDPSLKDGSPKHIPKIWSDAAGSSWSFWQFSSFGVLPPGIAGYVDLDVFRGTLDDLRHLAIAG